MAPVDALVVGTDGRVPIDVESTRRGLPDVEPRDLFRIVAGRHVLAVRVVAIHKGVAVIDKQWRRQEITADTVVLALGYEARYETVKAFQGLALEVYVVGDCSRPNNLMAAIHDGFNVAVEI